MSFDLASSFPGPLAPRLVPVGPDTGGANASAAVPSPSAHAAPAVRDVVSISEDARAAQAVGDSLRERLKARHQAAKGTDLSAFTDDELAQVALNRDGVFSGEEAADARGALNGRLAYSLAPHGAAVDQGDRRAQAMAINALHGQMSEDTRAALGWTPAVMAANNAALRADSARLGWLDNAPILSGLDQAARLGGVDFSGMKFNWLDSYPDPPWLDYPFNDGVSRFASDRYKAMVSYPVPPWRDQPKASGAADTLA